MKKIELLAPVGDKERLEAAVHFGADAVYFGGKKFGLRAFASNFEELQIKDAVEYCHARDVKVYVTVNILAHNEDFEGMIDYLKSLDEIGVDGVIVSDLGIASLVKRYTNLELHVSTQANVTNIYSAKVWVELGAKRLVLARELNIDEIKQIKEYVGNDIDIECFCHGAMCISYSGRCLLSNYFLGRDSNRGQCAQPCRWKYSIQPLNDQNNDLVDKYPIEEDSRGTYILNSKDMCLIEHVKELSEAGINSFKVEGRMKSTYYVATVINAYRRAIDNYLNNKEKDFDYIEELKKTSNRSFTTGFYFNSDQKTNKESALLEQTYDFVALVLEDSKDGKVLVELRNKFSVGDELEILSNTDSFNKAIKVDVIEDEAGNHIDIARKVKQRLYLNTDFELKKFDILRKKKF